MIFEPKVVIKTIMRLFTRIVALKIITEYVNINNMYTEYIKEISPHIFLLLGKENCIVWSVASGFKGVQAPPLPPSPPPPPIGPSVWFFLNVSDAKIIATVARYYSISQFLIFLRPKRTKFIWVFFFFLIFYLKSDRNLHPSQPYIRCRVVIGQVISLIPLIQLCFVQ